MPVYLKTLIQSNIRWCYLTGGREARGGERGGGGTVCEEECAKWEKEVKGRKLFRKVKTFFFFLQEREEFVTLQ